MPLRTLVPRIKHDALAVAVSDGKTCVFFFRLLLTGRFIKTIYLCNEPLFKWYFSLRGLVIVIRSEEDLKLLIPSQRELADL